LFPITHLYFYTLMFKPSSLGAIGAMFPDTTLLTGLRWADTHLRAVEFYDSLFGKRSFADAQDDKLGEFTDLALGFLTHGVDSGGLDFYGDEKYLDFEKGYSYSRAVPLVDEVIRVCRIPREMGLWKAHNFIEMGIESLVASSNPQIGQWVGEFGKDLGAVKRAAGILSRFYQMESQVFERAISGFVRFLKPSGSPEELGESYADVLRIRHGILDADPREISIVINKAAELIEGEYLDFLHGCAKKFIFRWGDLPHGKKKIEAGKLKT
jgi:hypothetical protein